MSTSQDGPGPPAQPGNDGTRLRVQLSRGGIGMLALKGINRALLLATGIVLARLLGTEGYGVYVYAIAVSTILSVLAKFGIPVLLVREVAVAQLRREWAVLRGVIRRGTTAVMAVSLALSALLALTGLLLIDSSDATTRISLLLVALALPMQSIAGILGAVLKGLRHVLLAEFARLVFWPAAFLVLVVFALLLDYELGPLDSLGLYLVAVIPTAALLGHWVRRRLPVEAVGVAPRYEDRRWLASAIPLALLAGTRVIHLHTDLVMLGPLTDSSSVGTYRVAATGALLVGWATEAIGPLLAPHAARLHAGGETGRLQRIAVLAVWATSIAALPVALVLVFAGSPVIGFVFGPEFAAGSAPLAVLAGTQFLGMLFGTNIVLLNMSGHERDTARTLAITTVANIVLNAALIPALGALGAALATGLSTLVWHFLLWLAVGHRLGFNSSIAGGNPIRAIGS